MHYEGLIDRAEHKKRIEKLKIWFKVVQILGTNIIQIPASFLGKDEITADLDVVVQDLIEVADLGAQEKPPVKFAYENLCWSTYFDTWEQGWDIVERVGRWNFGVCLDTYNIAGRVYADPAAPDGLVPGGAAMLKASLEKMVRTIDVEKVFFIQLVDAEKLRDPLQPGHAFYVDGQPARMNWSRAARLFYGEERGYLPVQDVLKAIIDGLGYKGWISMELFSRTMNEPGEQVPKEHARRAALAWEKAEKDIKSWIRKRNIR
jgi:4-hydroxyphenylpyruvate dioxygenase